MLAWLVARGTQGSMHAYRGTQPPPFHPTPLYNYIVLVACGDRCRVCEKFNLTVTEAIVRGTATGGLGTHARSTSVKHCPLCVRFALSEPDGRRPERSGVAADISHIQLYLTLWVPHCQCYCLTLSPSVTRFFHIAAFRQKGSGDGEV